MGSFNIQINNKKNNANFLVLVIFYLKKLTLTCHNSAIFKATEIYQYETKSSKHQDSNGLEFRILVASLVLSKYAYFKETTKN
jgi:hypothetical protein